MDRIANVVESLMTRTEAAVPVNTEDYINPADSGGMRNIYSAR